MRSRATEPSGSGLRGCSKVTLAGPLLTTVQPRWRAVWVAKARASVSWACNRRVLGAWPGVARTSARQARANSSKPISRPVGLDPGQAAGCHGSAAWVLLDQLAAAAAALDQEGWVADAIHAQEVGVGVAFVHYGAAWPDLAAARLGEALGLGDLAAALGGKCGDAA